MSQRVTITAESLAAVMGVLNLGEPPMVLRPDPMWRDSAAHDAMVASAWQEFDEVRLLDGECQPRTDVVRALSTLARPRLEYTAILVGDAGATSVVVATDEVDVVRVRKRGDAVTVSWARGTTPSYELLRQIPDAPAAPISAVNVRRDTLSDLDMFGYDDDDARTIARLTEQQPLGQGELSVARRDSFGRRAVSDPIRYQDYAFGRVLVVITAGYLSVAPAPKTLLLAKLEDAERTLQL